MQQAVCNKLNKVSYEMGHVMQECMFYSLCFILEICPLCQHNQCRGRPRGKGSEAIFCLAGQSSSHLFSLFHLFVMMWKERFRPPFLVLVDDDRLHGYARRSRSSSGGRSSTALDF